jgi:hypothetical protein
MKSNKKQGVIFFKPLRWLGSLTLIGLSVGCATYQEGASSWISKVQTGQHQQALQEIESQSKDTNKVLDAMNKGMVYRYQKDWNKSNEEFRAALGHADALRATSIGEAVGSSMLSEGFRSYEGAQFELLTLPILSAYNYIDKNDCAAARVEARRINELIKENNEPKKILPWAVFFSGLVYEMLGEYDNARVSYRQADALYNKILNRERKYNPRGAGSPNVLRTSLAVVQGRPDSPNRSCADFGLKEIITTFAKPQDAAASTTSNTSGSSMASAPLIGVSPQKTARLSPAQQRQQAAQVKKLAQSGTSTPAGSAAVNTNAASVATADRVEPPTNEKGELLVIYQHGMVSTMRSNHLTINAAPPLGIIKIALPSYGATPLLPAATVNVGDATESFDLSVVANYESLARAELDDNLPGMQARVVSRMLTRKVASAATQRSNNDTVKLLGNLMELSQLVTESADTRAWPLAPSAVYVGRKTMSAGKKRLRVQAGGYGVDVDIELEPGKTTLLNVQQAFPSVAATASTTAAK